MAKLSLSDILSGHGSLTTYNANNTLLETALENTLSRDGASPNEMNTNLDMNSNRILNLSDATNNSEPATYGQLLSFGDLTFQGFFQETLTATASQTVFNFSTITWSLSLSDIEVYINGVLQNSGYTKTDTNTITFNTGLDLADEVTVRGFAIQASSGSVADTLVTLSLGTTLDQKLQDFISVKDYGAVGDGVTDDTTAVQAALDSGAGTVLVPDGSSSVYIVNNLTVPSDTTVIVRGELKQIAGASDTDAVLKNSDQVSGNSNISLVFQGGKINGNKGSQTGAAGVAMYGIYFKNVSNLFMQGVRVEDNYVPTPGSGWNPGAVWIEDSDHIQIRDMFLSGYEGEGLLLDTCTYFNINNVITDATSGNTDAWSGVQITGESGVSSYGTVNNVLSRYAGASGFNIDGTFVTASNIHVSDNVFNSAINIGHTGKSSDHVTLSNFSVFNFSTAGTGSNDSGLTVSASTDINVSNGSIDGNSDAQADNGVFVGNLSARVNISNVRAENCAAQGFEFFESEVALSNCYSANNGGVGFLFAMNSGTQSLGKQPVQMTGCVATGNTGFGLSNQQKDSSNFYRIYAQNCRLTGNTGGTYTASANAELISEGCEFLASDTVASAATIDVRGLEVAYITGTTAITAITMTTRQRCTLIFDASVTVTDGANLALNANSNYSAKATDTLTVVERNGTIWEAGRSVN